MQPLGNVERIPMAAKVSVGFGSAFVTKDDECFCYEKPNMEYNSCISMAEVEAVAANFPDSDWRVHLCGPLSEIHYQRQGKENWVAQSQGGLNERLGNLYQQHGTGRSHWGNTGVVYKREKEEWLLNT